MATKLDDRRRVKAAYLFHRHFRQYSDRTVIGVCINVVVVVFVVVIVVVVVAVVVDHY